METKMPKTERIHRQAILCVALIAGQAAPAAAQGLPRARPEDVGLSVTALRKIDAQLQRWVDSGTFAGVIAVVARRGKLAYVASAGAAGSARPAIAPDARLR